MSHDGSSNLVADVADTATGVTLDAAFRVGRGGDNDFVLDHPTVSRHHAVIERVGASYFVRDLGSRNATRLNGRTLRERRPLSPGDRIRFGQVRVTFLVNGDPASAPTLDCTTSTAAPCGVVFNCVCGTRLWAKQEAVTGVVTCRTCRAKVVVPHESTDADSGETVSGVAFSAPPETLAAPVQTGTCSICQWQTNAEEQTTDCPSCGLTFHAECWHENRGCSAYGCAQVNALDAARRRPEPEDRKLTPDGIADRPTTLTDDPLAPGARLPVGHVLLGASVVGGLLGLLTFGLLPLIVSVAALATIAKRQRRGRRGFDVGNRRLAMVAAAVSILGAAAGMAVSSILWLGWSPGGVGVS